MSDRHEDTDARLDRLRSATDPVRPGADFAARVAATIARDAARTGWLGDLFRPARRLVPVAALAAALGLVWAAESVRALRAPSGDANVGELDTQW